MHNDKRKVMRVTRGRRGSLRGQVVVMVALMSVVLIGATALGVDLSLNTNQQRALQNVADSAALAGATDVGGNGFSGGLVEEATANTDALVSVGDNLGFPTGWQGAPGNTCPTSGIGYCTSATYGKYSVQVSTPPQNPKDPNYAKENYVEVDISETGTNQFGTVIGQTGSIVKAHAIAQHWGPSGTFGYALYASGQVGTGNQNSTVQGDVFIGTWFAPQSQGKSGLCAAFINGTEKGHVVFGSPQPPTVPAPPHARFPQMAPSDFGVTCPSTAGAVQAEAPAGVGNCPSGAVWDSSGMCEGLPAVPAIPEPCAAAGCTNGQNCTSGCFTGQFNCQKLLAAPAAGVYRVVHSSGGCSSGSDLFIDFKGGSFPTDGAGTPMIACVSFVLDPGASVTIYNGKSGGVLTSYGSGTTSHSTCNGARTPNATSFWSSASDTGSGATSLIVDGNGCCPKTDVLGAIYMPTGSISGSRNSALVDEGQVTVASWTDQSGNHPDPLVIDNPNLDVPLPEVLRLVE